MTDQIAKRYVVEANDEFGRIDYDRFDDMNEAIRLARELNREAPGCDARVIDIVEMIEVDINH